MLVPLSSSFRRRPARHWKQLPGFFKTRPSPPGTKAHHPRRDVPAVSRLRPRHLNIVGVDTNVEPDRLRILLARRNDGTLANFARIQRAPLGGFDHALLLTRTACGEGVIAILRQNMYTDPRAGHVHLVIFAVPVRCIESQSVAGLRIVHSLVNRRGRPQSAPYALDSLHLNGCARS